MFKKSFLITIYSCVFLLYTAVSLGTDGILYVRPRGQLGNELSAYWNAVKKDPSIRHKAITQFPPHCSLTGFFPLNHTESFYIQAVKDAIKSLKTTPRTITINGLIQGNQMARLDYIKLSSSYLLDVTKAFMGNASVPKTYLKDPQAFTYHITLRDHVFKGNVKTKMKRIQKLEKKIDLKAKVRWSLFFYERDDDGSLSAIKEFPL